MVTPENITEFRKILRSSDINKNQGHEIIEILEDENGQRYELVSKGEITLPRMMLDVVCSEINLEFREDDIVFISHPKTGTHWLFSILRLMTACEDAPVGIPSNMETFTPESLDELPSPRVIHSHMKPNFLPEEALRPNRKIILIVRNPKDTAVSLYHHMKKHRVTGLNISWDCFLHNWIERGMFYFNYFEFYTAWLRYIENHKSILVVHYEDLLRDGLGQLQRIQTYLGISKSDESLQGILNRTSINTLREEINSKKVFSPFLDKNGETIIFRKGAIGDWKNYFTVAQSERIDTITTSKFKNTVFKLDLMI